MERSSLFVALACSLISLGSARRAVAQTATVTLSSQKQLIRGIGGMSHAAWAGDLTAAERTTAFGNGDGQLGFSALRIPVSDGSPDSANVATAKAAIAAGAIVFATPWNAKGSMSSSQFGSYATHLNNFVSYMKGQGVDLYAIGTQNEPDYGSQGGWETWTASLCHDFALNYGAMIATKLISCESFNYAKSYYDPLLNDAAALANVAALGTHLYGTPVSGYAYPLADQKGGGKERWMTEHYTDSTTDANSWPNALGVATELHHAMVEGQFSLYTWWYIVRSYGPIGTNGAVTKRGWCMAQFSKFIRPGFYRVDATASPSSGVYLSAYKSATDVVLVVVNTNSSASSLNVAINGTSIASYDRFTTSSSKNLASEGKVTATNGTVMLSLDAQSVTTLHGSGVVSGGGGGATGSSGAAGAPGIGGRVGGAGGSGTGGLTGAAGSRGRGGAPGSGGVVATGGSPGTGGAETGSGGNGSGTGGSPGTGGRLSATGGSSGSAGGAPPSENGTDGGCSCRVDAGASRATGFGLFGALGTLVLLRQRRRGRRSA